MEIKTILHFPDFWNGIVQDEQIATDKTWQGHLVRVARMPVIGMATSTLGALFNLIRLICGAIVVPFSILAQFFLKDANKLTSIASIYVGLSLMGEVYSIVNIATFGLLGWKSQFVLIG